MGSDYRFLTVWRVAGTVQEVMAVLGDAECTSPVVAVGVPERRSGERCRTGRNRRGR